MSIDLKHVAQVTCTDANTNYPLTADATIKAPSVFVQAESTNTGIVRVGGMELSATQGFTLSAGNGTTIQYTGPDSLNDTNDFLLSRIKVRSTQAGDKVNVTYLKEV